MAVSLEQALRDLIAEARSHDGVGRSVYAAIEAAERARQQVAAVDRIVAELNDDGISDEALAAAEATLQSVDSPADSSSGEARNPVQ